MTGGSGDPIRRLERLDAAFTRYNSVRSLLNAEAALERRAFGEAVAFRDLARPHIHYYNRALGLGPGADALDEIIAWYHGAKIPCGLTTTPDRLQEPLMAALGERGFRVIASQCFFWLELDGRDQPERPEHIEIRRAGEGDIDAVFEIFLADEPEPRATAETRRKRAPAHLRDEFPIYLAMINSEPVAMATMFLHGGVAFLGNANTAIGARGRGCQRALIEHRLCEAARMGCDAAATDTGFGTTSHRNVERAGMSLLFQDLSWTLPVAG